MLGATSEVNLLCALQLAGSMLQRRVAADRVPKSKSAAQSAGLASNLLSMHGNDPVCSPAELPQLAPAGLRWQWAEAATAPVHLSAFRISKKHLHETLT